ncbi:MAG: hypothetical protein CM1200mP30_08580 [Pseudomonadota bacterium]|nr:MAG: hypothetical protein CM1200mP30_08580 [Pseudomonadota bacterium]
MFPKIGYKFRYSAAGARKKFCTFIPANPSKTAVDAFQLRKPEWYLFKLQTKIH